MDWGRIAVISLLVLGVLFVALGGWLTWQSWRAERESD